MGVELVLLALSRLTDSPLGLRVFDHDEVPRLEVGARGGGYGRSQALEHDLAGNRPGGIIPNRAAACHFFAELSGAARHLVG
jgi:hypothetical protein